MDLSDLRARIDAIDSGLLDALARRFAVGDEVGRFKAEHGLPARDPDREAEMTARYRAEAERRGLDPDVVEGIFRLILDTTVARHEQVPRQPAAAPPHVARTEFDQSR